VLRTKSWIGSDDFPCAKVTDFCLSGALTIDRDHVTVTLEEQHGDPQSAEVRIVRFRM
jgi:hypothetical protein